MTDCYKDDAASVGAAVERACVKRGLFDGYKVQRSDLLWIARQEHRIANGGRKCAQQETLGRELRHRNERTLPDGTKRQRLHFADRALLAGWRILCEDGRVWTERV